MVLLARRLAEVDEDDSLAHTQLAIFARICESAMKIPMHSRARDAIAKANTLTLARRLRAYKTVGSAVCPLTNDATYTLATCQPVG